MLVLVLQKGIGQFPYHKSFDDKLSVVAKNTERREYIAYFENSAGHDPAQAQVPSIDNALSICKET